MFRINKSIVSLGIPLVFSASLVVKRSLVLFVFFILAHFLVLKLVPEFRGRESIWMFIMVAFSSIPVNALMITILNKWGLVFGSFAVVGIIRCIFYYVILFSAEEIVMGVLTRMLWKKQYRSYM